MITIDSCRKEISRREREIRDIRVPVSDIRVENCALAAGPERLSLSGDGFFRLCAVVRSPSWYVAQLPLSLRSAVLQWHLAQGALGRGLTCLLARDDQFVGVVNPALVRLGGGEVLDAVLEAPMPASCDVVIHHLEWLGDSFQVDVVGDGLHQEVPPGDIVEGGLRIRHSLIGQFATSIESYILRLVCSNGLTYRECVSRRASRTRRLPVGHPQARDLQLAQVRRLATEAWSGLREKLGALRTLPEEELNVPHLLRSWIVRAHLSPRRLLPLLTQAWQTKGGRANAFDALNALTRVASHDATISLRERRALAALAGVLAFTRIHFCPRCFSLLRGPLHDDDPAHEGERLFVQDNAPPAQPIPNPAADFGRSR
ncbi:MAG: hypothetical protein ACLQVM_30600 [Terriglobia bacterium]